MTVAARDLAFPRVDFHELPSIMQWHQGEHCTIIAPTGAGKTTLAKNLIPITPAIREYVMVLVTKKRDKVVTAFPDYQAMPMPQEWARRVLVTPSFPRDTDAQLKAHRATFRNALEVAYAQGGWTVYDDEVAYIVDDLSLGADMKRMWMQGRSNGNTIIAATQRPRHIPLLAYSMATHLFLGPSNDMEDIKRIRDIAGNVDKGAIMARVARLARFTFIYVNTREGIVVETTNGGG